MHTILIGPINSGKSTRLWTEVQKWIAEGKKVSGWISMPSSVDRRQSSAEKNYDIVFITMSKIHEPLPFIRTKPFKKSFAWKRFHFDQSIFDRVVETSGRTSLHDFGKPDIFVIDEVGPLELEDKKGFWPVLKSVYEKYSRTTTVVREDCLDRFKQAFPENEYLVQSTLESLPPS